ncbi:GUN4 domain-containing protein [Roseofilum capinflatum]|uniref:GUN4 domain-containing protein n=1 Tax=Roseofilum capinflatum BLCC-M114 TaxID=3022440 RepID=A0ABT7BAR1_9CYAN|nr:GUN4 domain-containing protein [Roseofilum capinflatum]MDJ1176264.1 GUN4 domain-containing protein [Roseofilum capinflatum BLCC-M114]
MEEVETRFEVRLIQLAEQVDRLTKEQEALKTQLAEIKGSGLSATIQARPVPPADAQPLQSASELDVPSDDIPLQSSSGQSYARLKYLLKCGRWQEADEETAFQLQTVTGYPNCRNIPKEEIESIPAEDLQIMGRLWSQYSYDKFGFIIQSQIYQKMGGTEESRDIVLSDFANILGWYPDDGCMSENDLILDIEQAPIGYFPQITQMSLDVYKVLLCREEWSKFPAIPDIEIQMKQVAEKERIRSSNFYQEELTREREEERATLIDAFFKEKFTEIDEELLAIKPKIIALPKDKFADALLKLGQWSREQLLEHWQAD